MEQYPDYSERFRDLLKDVVGLIFEGIVVKPSEDLIYNPNQQDRV